MLRDKDDVYSKRFDEIRKLVLKRKLALGQQFSLIAADKNSPNGTLYHLALLRHDLWQAYGRLATVLSQRGGLSPYEEQAIAVYRAEARRRKYDKSMLRGRPRKPRLQVTPVALAIGDTKE